MNRHWCPWCGIELFGDDEKPGDLCGGCQADHRWFAQRYGRRVVMLRHPMPGKRR